MKTTLLFAADGPECIEIYTDDDRGVVDWAPSFPALYIDVSINGARGHFGPFTLGKVYQDIKDALR